MICCIICVINGWPRHDLQIFAASRADANLMSLLLFGFSYRDILKESAARLSCMLYKLINKVVVVQYLMPSSWPHNSQQVLAASRANANLMSPLLCTSLVKYGSMAQHAKPWLFFLSAGYWLHHPRMKYRALGRGGLSKVSI